MTMVDKISFRFSMADEAFARGLYADWERFCRQCAIDVMDEFFTRYDSRDIYIEIDRLNLELGGISQKDFYEEFPLRLSKALEREALPYLYTPGSQETAFSAYTEIRRMQAFAQEKRVENLLHYLECGFCLPEWDCIGFDPEEELRHIDDRKTLERLLAVITENPNASERFFARVHDELSAAMLSVLLLSPVPGHAGKQRYLATALERTPHAVLRFIHETKNTGCMDNMALLLENPLVRQVMTIETENHAEIDVPEYWYVLYGWILEYYPFNGVPMFGDKHHFRLHLNRSLLSFIRRRSYPSYLSKKELTVQFLTEVFGTEYCFAVLNAIYLNRHLNPDGSPSSGNSYVREIYYMLLQLSMIKPKKQPNSSKEAGTARMESISSFGEWLETDGLPDTVKKRLLTRLVAERTEMLIQWLENCPESRYIRILAALMDDRMLLAAAGCISSQLAEAIAAWIGALDEFSSGTIRLKGLEHEKLETAFIAAVLKGIGMGAFASNDSVREQCVKIGTRLYEEAAGTSVRSVSENAEQDILPVPLREFLRTAAEKTQFTASGREMRKYAAGIDECQKTAAYISVRKQDMLKACAAGCPEGVGRIIRDTIVSEEVPADRWADILHKNTFLAVAASLNGIYSDVLAKAIRRVEAFVVGTNLFAGSSAELNRSFAKAMALIIAERQNLTSMGCEEIVRMFISYWRLAVIGQKEIPLRDREQWERLERDVAEAVTEEEMDYADYAEGAAARLGGILWEDIREDADEHLFDELVSLFLSPAVSDTRKSQLLRYYARWQPVFLWKLLRYSSENDVAGETAVRVSFRQWSGWLGMEVWQEMISGVSLSLGETLRQTNAFLSSRYHIPETALAEMSVRFIAGWRMEQRYYEDASVVIGRYVSGLGEIAAGTDCSKILQGALAAENGNSDGCPDEKAVGRKTVLEALSKEIETALSIEKAEASSEEAAEPDCIEVSNAGLCLLALWLPRLFDMLGLLSESSGGKKDLKDTGARIRAVFILQRLVTDEKKEYAEQALAFNRILAGCPFHVPLPKTLEPAENEIQTVESMLAGVKANWSKLRNTSTKGFQSSFIERPGRLEQREGKWVLYVEERAYDILLDSLPWSFRQIRLPWLRKRINVVWRDKEEYGFEKL